MSEQGLVASDFLSRLSSRHILLLWLAAVGPPLELQLRSHLGHPLIPHVTGLTISLVWPCDPLTSSSLHPLSVQFRLVMGGWLYPVHIIHGWLLILSLCSQAVKQAPPSRFILPPLLAPPFVPKTKRGSRLSVAQIFYRLCTASWLCLKP